LLLEVLRRPRNPAARRLGAGSVCADAITIDSIPDQRCRGGVLFVSAERLAQL